MSDKRRDLISIFAQHRVAANLLMVILLLAGAVSLFKLNVQFFPTFSLDYVTVRIEWRGASAEDIEEGITTPVEQALRSINYVKEMTSTSAYGVGSIVLEFEENIDMGLALDEVKEKVGQMRNLPADSEIPAINIVTNYEPIAKLLVTTEGDLSEVRYLVQRMEDELLERGVSNIRIRGLPAQEIAIQLSHKDLAELDMSLGQVGERIAALSRDLPAGEVGQGESARQLRSLDQRRSEQAFGSLTIKADQEGNLIRLDDVALIEQRARKNQVSVFYEGKPAVELSLRRTENADSIDSAKILETWMDEQTDTLPAGVGLHVYDAKWTLIKGRIDLLLRNGLGGLALVLAVLFLFLYGRVAWWIAVGIPVSFMGALAVLYLAGGSINMLSLFGLIMALGIIVDDAIVVGEDGLALYQKGDNALGAAEGGARRMFAPVMASSLTTIASFLPLMMVGGIMGNILFDIPFVVICVIIASLVESFLILPGHLRHTFHRIHHAKPSRIRAAFDNGFANFRDNIFQSLVRTAVSLRGVTIALALGALILTAGLMAGGRLQFTFFPSPDGTELTASVRFVAGTPSAEVARFLTEINRALTVAQNKYEEEIVLVAVTHLGSVRGGNGRSQTAERFGAVYVELTSPDDRSVRNKDFIKAWRSEITLPAGLASFSLLEPSVGPPGRDIDMELGGADAIVLKQAAEKAAEALRNVAGVSAVEDDLPYGQEQLIYQLTGQAESLGLTVDAVGRQLRAAFDGKLVQIFQQGDDEIEVRVMLPDAARNTMSTLADMQITLPTGGRAPLMNMINLDVKRGFDVLRHTDGLLSVHVQGSVDPTVNNNNNIIATLKRDILPELEATYGVSIEFKGRAEEQKETMADMMTGLIIATCLIYLVLAWVFASYGLPLVVMAAIPFGLIGALLGHWFMGIDLTILSLFGIFGLSGIVVNDSIILVSFFKQLREQGMATTEAIIQAASQRLRAVLLTSLTTIGGLLPILFETSTQAQFLIPMAVSISFGLMFATVLVLLVIPALLSVYESYVDFVTGRKDVAKTVWQPK